MASPAWRNTSISACAPTPTPLRLSIDIRVEGVVREELLKAMDEFQAIGACGIVMDVQHRRSAGDGQPARLRRQQFPHRAGGRPVQPRGDRHVRAGQHVQAADRVDGAGRRHRAHLGRVRRLPSDPYRPFHHHRLRGQAPLAVSAGGAGLLVQPGCRAYRRGCRRRAPARLAEDDGHVQPRADPVARSRPADHPVRRRTGRRSRR